MGATITIDRAAKEYRRGSETVRALAPLSLTIEAGQIVALMGPSGSGKSTLLHLMAGFETPDHGRITLTAGTTPCRLGFVFQHFRLLPLLTAHENVEMGLLPFERNRRARHDRATDALTRLGLSDRARHFPHQLSGGQQQRVAIARAIAIAPDIVLADEPTANLDSATGADVIAQLCNQARRDKCTVVIATHDARLQNWVDRVIMLKDGAVATPTTPKTEAYA